MRGLSDYSFQAQLIVLILLIFFVWLLTPAQAQRLPIYDEPQKLDHILKFDSNGRFMTQWGEDGSSDGRFLHIHDLAVTAEGYVYATDEEKSEVQKFDSNGNFIGKWGSGGSGDGQFSSNLEDITVDSLGNVYVVDSGHDRIQKFDGDGRFIMKWGAEGTGQGLFNRPIGIAVDSLSNVYVTDRDNNRIQKFTSDGMFITKWGSNGTGDGQFAAPAGIAIDRSTDRVFVVDEANNLIQKFNSNGEFITKWGSRGNGNGQFDAPRGIATDSQGNLYLVDSKNQRVQKFSSDGIYIKAFGIANVEEGSFIHPRDIDVDAHDNIYVSDQKLQHPEISVVGKFMSNTNSNSSSTAYTIQGEYYDLAMKWGSVGSEDGQFERPHDVLVDSSGNIYVTDRDRNDVQVFSSSSEFLYKFGSGGTGNGEFNVPYSITADKEGYLYVVDRENDRIQKFFNNGTFIDKFESPVGGSEKGFSSPEDMAIDPVSDFLYVADTGNNRIVKMDRDFRFILEWGSEGTGSSQFRHPHGLGIDSQGFVYVNELENPRIQKFDGSGNLIKQWGSEGTGPGQFSLPIEHLEIDPFDNVWMVDGEGNPRIQKFDSNGTYLGSIGSGPCKIADYVKEDPLAMAKPHQCDGGLHKPEHVFIDSSGSLYIVDRGNQRIEVFHRLETPYAVSGSRCLQTELLPDPCLTIQTYFSGMEFPTGMAFLSEDDILVIERDLGTVRRIVNSELLDEPLLKVNVATKGNEQGMLGIAVTSRNVANDPGDVVYVFLYYTESETEDGSPIGNRLYRYELVDNKLINPKLFLDLPAGLAHNGGVLTIGPDNNLYVAIGNLFSERTGARDWDTLGDTLAQNIDGAPLPDGRGGILRFTQNGSTADGIGILGESHPLNKYYAYGIRNSFGLGFDPVTGDLWDTENGPNIGDEINLVQPGFNSGSNPIHGIAANNSIGLVSFDGRGRYSDPEFTWNEPVAPTAVTFLDSDKLGEGFENDMFVGSAVGILFHFDLDEARTGLLLDGSLSDKVANSFSELEDRKFGVDFGTITDIDVGPDGYLYILSVLEGGKIFRIIPKVTLYPAAIQEQLPSYNHSETLVPLTAGVSDDEARIQMVTDNGGIAVAIVWDESQLNMSRNVGVRLSFSDLSTGNTLDADVLYDIRIISVRDNSTFLIREGLIANGGSDNQIIRFPNDEEYRIVIEVKGLLSEDRPIDTTRNGIASTIIVVPEFPLHFLLFIAVGAIFLAFRLLIRKQHYRAYFSNF